ncbi:homoserine dehydrogenase family protein [Flavobacterium turcicum]|uniref:homoserine dehydrogenase n=1 Tax=Flavobacterium turcicum TaxID=2764718 RepID=A0ABR7JGU0_9FLAO|nr:aspartate kinase [Flavobacterium turcicum]MBC5863716.1 aspartate kinase [Flavobacterium turcicum]NHL02336.1 aspartate kinase [Flavobacterium turcicum]
MSTLRINLILFGIGNVGSALINQIFESQQFFQEKKNIDLRFPIITNSSLAFFEKEGVKNAWESNFDQLAIPFTIDDIIDYAKRKQLENVIVVDATASADLVRQYIPIIQNGFDIVAANKNANIAHIDFYREIRRNLKKFDKSFLYETNFEAAIPALQIVNDLYYSGEKITKIKGVFSESLSYILNRFGSEEVSFSTIVQEAKKNGLLPKESKEEFSGVSVAKKVLLLARELGCNVNLSDVKINPLLQFCSERAAAKSKFPFDLEAVDGVFREKKNDQKQYEVLRYIGEISIPDNKLEVKLISETIYSAIGQLKGASTVFEIYTEARGDLPIVVNGDHSGKKAETIARGLLSDILKVSEKIKTKETIWL